MSWQDRDKLDLRITTGDNKVYTVFWLKAQLKIKWHGVDQSYIQLPDSRVDKRQRQGRTFPMEFFFMGDDHLEEAGRFRASLDDLNPCTIEHPYYNTIVCHILELDINNDELNISRCTCLAMETMIGYSAIVSNRVDIVLLKKVELDTLLDSQPEIKLSITEVTKLKDTTAKVKKLGMKIINLPEQSQEYFNAFSTASSYVNTFSQSPIVAMQALNTFYNLPVKFISSVENRITVLKEQFDILRSTIFGISGPSAKKLYEDQQTVIVGSMCQAAALPLTDDYLNATTAVQISQTIWATYNIFLQDLDSLQTNNNGSPLSFIPDHQLYIKLGELVTATTSGLYDIALSGRRQRSFTLTENSCVILLTHMLYRLDPQDKNMQKLIDNNGFTYRDIALGIEKGRRVVYFV